MSESRLRETTIERSATRGEAGGALQPAVHFGFAACMVVFVLLYSRTYLSLIETWADTGTFQYAFLIFPISAVLVWSRREWLARVAARPRPGALWVVAALTVLWLLGAVADINLAQHIAVVVIWPVMVYVFYGPRVGGVLAFALGYLLFAIPFGNFMVGPLQTVTAHLSVFALKLTGVPVIMHGHFIDTPAAAWHVAEACSGIKFFVATTAFGVLYAHLFFTGLRRRLIFVLISLIVPIIANGLRVYFTILIGENFGIKYASGTDHLIFGWQFFGTVLIVLFLCGWPWHQPPPRGPVPDTGLPEDASTRMRWIVPVAFLLIAVPAIWFFATGLMAARADQQPGAAALPSHLASYSAVQTGANGESRPPKHGLDVHLSRGYGDIARPIQVDYFGANDAVEGPDMLNIRQALYDTHVWHNASAPGVVSGANGQRSYVALQLRHAGQGTARRTMLYVYRIGSRWITSPIAFTAWRAFDRLLGRAAPTGILVVSEAGQVAPDALAPVAADAIGFIQEPAQ